MWNGGLYISTFPMKSEEIPLDTKIINKNDIYLFIEFNPIIKVQLINSWKEHILQNKYKKLNEYAELIYHTKPVIYCQITQKKSK